MTVTALIVAAGSGSRMGADLPKQYRPIGGKPVLRWAVEAMTGHPLVGGTRVVVGAGQQELAQAALEGLDVGPLIEGGAERSMSVGNGLLEIESEFVLVHDAARPFCPPAVIDRLLKAMETHRGAVPVLPIGDTLARVDGDLGEPIDRERAVRVQTPQAFRSDILRQSLDRWTGPPPTDEASVVRAAGHQVAAVAGDPLLDKLTSPADWEAAERLMHSRLVSRTGMGFDVHAFVGAGPIMLGGIEVPHDRGLAGHSDADVILHAITDALLGAAGLGDIGMHFPPSDARWKGASSDLFLNHAADLVRQAGGIIDNVDCTLICEAPKLGPYREAMRQRIADILTLDIAAVGLKATTTERLGFTGRREGVAAQAIATIRLPTP